LPGFDTASDAVITNEAIGDYRLAKPIAFTGVAVLSQAPGLELRQI
jgi:hypothetical protein